MLTFGTLQLIYLLFFVVFSSIFSLCIKWVHNRASEDIITIGAINYIVAATAIAPWCFTGIKQTGDFVAIATGGAMGLVYFVAFFFVIYCVRVVGVSSTMVVSSLSLLLPIIVAAFVWESTPNMIQIAGIALALVSLLMIAIKPKPKPATVNPKPDKTAPQNEPTVRDWKPLALLFVFFLLCGFSRIAQETFKYESVIDQKPTFLLAAFTIAGIPSLILLIYRFRPILKMEFVIGIIMGLSNGLQTFWMLKSLDFIPGYIAFPLSSAGGIVFTTAVATSMLNEKLGRRSYIGIAVSVVALVLLNWQ